MYQNTSIFSSISLTYEKTEKQNIYFYLISHRNSNAYNNADIERMEGRFHIVQYNMETLTTYRIMAATIRILDEQQYHSE